MERKEFLEKTIKAGFCCSAFTVLLLGEQANIIQNPVTDDKNSIAEMERDFIGHWLSDLLNAMNEVLDEKTRIKLIEACGKGCFQRHQFKIDIAMKGKGDLNKLIEAYKNNFEIWQKEDDVHIRYGEVSKMCYCPVAKFISPKENDLHCECTRMTHQTIFEAALERSFKVEIVESLRRGGKTCHFIVHLS